MWHETAEAAFRVDGDISQASDVVDVTGSIQIADWAIPNGAEEVQVGPYKLRFLPVFVFDWWRLLQVQPEAIVGIGSIAFLVRQQSRICRGNIYSKYYVDVTIGKI